MIFTARIINQPPSKKYVFGYEKAEGIATKILSLVIFYAGVQMLISSIGSIFSDESKEIPSAIAIYVTIFSIIGKLLLASYQYKQGKKIGSLNMNVNISPSNTPEEMITSLRILIALAVSMELSIFFHIQTAYTRLYHRTNHQSLYYKIFDQYFHRFECRIDGWSQRCQCI